MAKVFIVSAVRTAVGKGIRGTRVSEQELLALELEGFLSLCGEEKTRDRISHMLMKGKPLRN